MAKKASQIELELNRATESLALNTQKVEEREKALLAAEMEVFNLNKKVQALDGTAEHLDDRILSSTHRLDKASTAVDENDRMKKVLENRAGLDEERIKKLENELKNSRTQADEADKKCDEILKRLAQVLKITPTHICNTNCLKVEGDLEKGEERAETGEMKILELEEELRYGFSNHDMLQLMAYGQGCGKQPQVSRGERGEGREEGGELQGPDQEPDCEAQAEHRGGRVCREICPEIAERGQGVIFSILLDRVAYTG